MLIGLFEVGYALRTYYVIVNASRETARYASRAGYLNGNFDQVVSHTMGTLDGTMGAGWDKQGSEQVTELRTMIDTLDCNTTPVYTMTRQTFTWPADAKITPALDITKTHRDMAQFHYDLNCSMMAKSVAFVPRQDISAVIATVCWEHHQLFGFPIISNPFTDPIKFCVDTVMRKTFSRK